MVAAKLAIASFVAFAAAGAAAQSTDDERSSSEETAARAGQQGAFLLQTMAPGAGRASPGVAFTTGGYDGARREAIMNATGDMHVYGPLDLRSGSRTRPMRRKASRKANRVSARA